MHAVHRICGRQALLPRSMVVPLCYNPMEDPLHHGGFADVWRGQHQGRDVAARVLRVYLNDGFRKIRRVGGRRYPQLVKCTNELTVSGIAVLQEGCDMERPSPSERVATIRCDDDRESVRDGIGVDGEG